MKKRARLLHSLVVLCCALLLNSSTYPYKVGLTIVATGKYIQFVEPLIESARKYFCPGHEVTYFVFTDGTLDQAQDVIKIPHHILGWPKDTMCRCFAYVEAHKELEKMDYLFACDADMLFVDTVGDEILSERVATQHPGFYKRMGTPETRQESMAYLNPSIFRPYFAGGFYGGTSAEFLKLAHTMKQNVETDLNNNIIAVWHDESHLNRYFADNAPTLMLTPEYCMPESKKPQYYTAPVLAMKGKLIALDKDHSALRTHKVKALK